MVGLWLREPEGKAVFQETGDILQDLTKLLVQDFPHLTHTLQALDVRLDLIEDCLADLLELEDLIMARSDSLVLLLEANVVPLPPENMGKGIFWK